MQELVGDKIGRQVMETFLETEFSQENIRFWQCVQDLKFSGNREIERKSQQIYDEFLGPSAASQVCPPYDSGYIDGSGECRLENVRLDGGLSEEGEHGHGQATRLHMRRGARLHPNVQGQLPALRPLPNIQGTVYLLLFYSHN